MLPCCVGIYAIQNNLLFIAVENLEAATFQILYQLKILTTALFSVSMLSKSLSGSKWISLVILMAGVAMVQLETMKTSSSSGQSNTKTGDPLLGLITVVTACITSGFAGVYFEKILKTSPTSIWMRNIQLSLFGASFSWAAMMINDGSKVMEKGVWQNYDWVTWVVVFNQALGGLIVAIVVKYADNILKVRDFV
jgi:UDP-sugar transporter A1/2/3